MKKQFLISTITALMLAGNANAESAASHASKASEHSLAASGHTAVSVGQVAVSVVEIPLQVTALAGDSLQAVGDSLIDATHQHRPQPLEITEITITVDPSPRDAVNQSADKD